MRKNAILQHPLCPPYLSIDELGWEEFLNRWDKEVFEFLKTQTMRFGVELAGLPDSQIDKSKHDDYIQRLESTLKCHLPREYFFGGIAYPPKNLVEEQIAEEKFRAIHEALEKLFTYNNHVYGQSEHQILIRGTSLFQPASEQEIQSAETRFGVELPPSYKDFLRVSNGCLLGLGWTLVPVSKIGWMRDLHVHFIHGDMQEYIDEGPEPVADKVYYDYDELWLVKEPFPFYRSEKFLKALLITNPRDEDIGADINIYPPWPKATYEDGEWEAFAQNGTRARSFKHMMEYRYLVNIIGWRKAAETWKNM
jgi:hypothetical protein